MEIQFSFRLPHRGQEIKFPIRSGNEAVTGQGLFGLIIPIMHPIYIFTQMHHGFNRLEVIVDI